MNRKSVLLSDKQLERQINGRQTNRKKDGDMDRQTDDQGLTANGRKVKTDRPGHLFTAHSLDS